MDNKWPQRLFVTGTSTGVGKTMVCSILMAGLRGVYWKPVQSGLDGMTDTQRVRTQTGLPGSHFAMEIYRLKRPLSPHASAALEGVHIEFESFKVPEVERGTHLVVEGAGGIMVPLNEQYLMIDLMKKFNFPILLVALSSLGTINHTLLSLEQLRRHGLNVLGVAMNGHRNHGNKRAIEWYGKVRVLAEIEPIREIGFQALLHSFQTDFHL
jgi:dethiobiotin synthetase